jgi:cytochrome b561
MTDHALGSVATSARYSLPHIAVHWAMAALILIQLPVALYMGAQVEDSPAQDRIELVHISLGLTILTLAVVRLALRLAFKPAPMPMAPGWEATLARGAHVLMYVLIFAIPLTGWALKSFGPNGVSMWGLVRFPSLPAFAGLPREVGYPVYGGIENAHILMAWLLVATVVLHVSGVVLHSLRKQPLLWRMLP